MPKMITFGLDLEDNPEDEQKFNDYLREQSKVKRETSNYSTDELLKLSRSEGLQLLEKLNHEIGWFKFYLSPNSDRKIDEIERLQMIAGVKSRSKLAKFLQKTMFADRYPQLVKGSKCKGWERVGHLRSTTISTEATEIISDWEFEDNKGWNNPIPVHNEYGGKATRQCPDCNQLMHGSGKPCGGKVKEVVDVDNRVRCCKCDKVGIWRGKFEDTDEPGSIVILYFCNHHRVEVEQEFMA